MFLPENVRLIAGNANPPFAQAVAAKLGTRLAEARVGRFSDGEIRIAIHENMRGMDVFVLQPTCPPVNDNLMELLILLDALRRASAARITAVVPYFGYARQDRKAESRSPISAKLVADMIVSAGAHRLLSLDLHSGQMQGFFNVPVDNLFAEPLFADDIRTTYGTDLVVVSPDVGGVVRARSLANRLGVPLAIIDKRRSGPNESQVMNVIGDVKGRLCVMIDDMVDTAGTLCKAADALVNVEGAAKVVAYATHGVLSGEARARIAASHLGEVVVTDSLPVAPAGRPGQRLRVVSAAPLVAEAIRRVAAEESLSPLFA